MISRWILPTKLKPFYRQRRGTQFLLLDVGCGNHSPTLTKRWYPQCVYHGLDRARYNNTVQDEQCIDKFYSVDLECSDLSELPSGGFDVIVMSHVIEHLANGLAVVDALCSKLAVGGSFYIEFPSERSLRLPRGRNSLNFCDDPTHRRVYAVREIANIMLARGCRIVACGRRRNWPRLALGILALPAQAYALCRYRRLEGVHLWDLMGFADFVYAVRADVGDMPGRSPA